MAKVLISGASGLVGRYLTKMLQKRGHEVVHLVRKHIAGSPHRSFLWAWEKNWIEEGALEGIDAIVHLAGAGIFEERWTTARQQLIEDSRVKSGELILQTIQKTGLKPRVFVSASGTGYYGALSSEHVYTENDAPAGDFLGRTCQKWEAMAWRYQELGIRTTALRTGVVLAPDAVLIQRLVPLTKWGLGAALGSGKQYLPWIHVEDLCRMYVNAIEDEKLSGPYNAVSPKSPTNAEFTQLLAETLHRKVWSPNVPAFLLKAVLGQRAALITEGSRVSAAKIQEAGFEFNYPLLAAALIDVCQPKV